VACYDSKDRGFGTDYLMIDCEACESLDVFATDWYEYLVGAGKDEKDKFYATEYFKGKLSTATLLDIFRCSIVPTAQKYQDVQLGVGLLR